MTVIEVAEQILAELAAVRVQLNTMQASLNRIDGIWFTRRLARLRIPVIESSCMPATKQAAPVKASVFLSPALHRAAKIAAMDAGKCLSEFVADLVAAKLKKEKL